MTKKLNNQNINKSNTKFNEKLTIQVKDRFGEIYDVEIYKHFKKMDVQKLVVEYSIHKEELPSIVSDLELIKNSTFLFPALLVKFFTNVPIPDDLVELISTIEVLVNLEVLDQIIGALPQEEIERVNELIKKMTDNLDLTEKLLNIEKNKYNDTNNEIITESVDLNQEG